MKCPIIGCSNSASGIYFREDGTAVAAPCEECTEAIFGKENVGYINVDDDEEDAETLNN